MIRLRRPCLAALIWLLTACGGQTGRPPSTDEVVSGGAAGAASEPTDVIDAGGSSAVEGGAAPVAGQAGATAAGGAAAGGAAPDDATPRIGSATRYCENELYCFGLACYAPEGTEAQVCVSSCSSDTDCSSAEVCLESADLQAGCYRRCDTPFDCEYGFDCFDFSNQHQMLVCFPTPWAGLWQREHR